MKFRIGIRTRMGAMQTIGDVINGMIDEYGLNDDFSIDYIRKSWTTVAGDLAVYSRPERIEDGILTVSSSHPAVSNEIILLKPVLIDRFNTVFRAGVKDIQLQLKDQSKGGAT
jgi:hypothetical protein